MAGHIVEYRTIPGYEDYLVGTDASMWSVRCGVRRRLKVSLDSRGYMSARVRDENGKRYRAQVGRFMLMAFRGLAEYHGMDACHDDGNKLNNTLDNLKWGTRLDNTADKARHGRIPKGERHFKAKITDEQVALIRSMPVDGRGRLHGTRKLARRLGISARHLLDIRKGKSRIA